MRVILILQVLSYSNSTDLHTTTEVCVREAFLSDSAARRDDFFSLPVVVGIVVESELKIETKLSF